MKNDKGLTLQDLCNLAVEQGLEPDSIYLLTSDCIAMTEVDFSDECPTLWFLGDGE